VNGRETAIIALSRNLLGFGAPNLYIGFGAPNLYVGFLNIIRTDVHNNHSFT